MRFRIGLKPQPPTYLLIAQRGRIEYEAALLLKSMSLLRSFDMSNVVVASPVNSPVWKDDPTPSDQFRAFCAKFGVRTMTFENKMFGRRYAISNKFYAIEKLGQTDRLVFIDSDMIFLKKVRIDFRKYDALVCLGGESFPRPETRGQRDAIWRAVYALFDLDLDDFVNPAYGLNELNRYPYFNAGTFGINNPKFHQLYAGTAHFIYQNPPEILKTERMFPFLDQIALPIALARAGCRWTTFDRSINRFSPAAHVAMWHYQFLFRALIHPEPHVTAFFRAVRDDKPLVEFLSDWPAFRLYILGEDPKLTRELETVIDGAAPNLKVRAVREFLKARDLPRK